MNGTTAFTTTADGSSEKTTCHPSGDNTCYPSGETFTVAEPVCALHPAYDHAKNIFQIPTIMSPTGTATT
jgi:hypothetical protein